MAQMNPCNVNNENSEMCEDNVTVGSRSFVSLFPIPLHDFNINISYIDSRSSFILLVSHLCIYPFTTYGHGSTSKLCFRLLCSPSSLAIPTSPSESDVSKPTTCVLTTSK